MIHHGEQGLLQDGGEGPASCERREEGASLEKRRPGTLWPAEEEVLTQKKTLRFATEPPLPRVPGPIKVLTCGPGPPERFVPLGP